MPFLVAIALGVTPLALDLTGRAASSTGPASWPLPNLDLGSTRSLAGSGIDRADVGRLHLVWRFRLSAPLEPSGSLTATPVVENGVVYLQDMSSEVFALDLESGRVLWRHRFVYALSPGPNGLAVSGNRVYGATPTTMFALAAGSGKVLWSRFLVRPGEPIIDTAPQVAGDTVYTSTIGLPPGGRGVLYALDARTGAVRWSLSTIKEPWKVPSKAGGGGAWYPPSVAGDQVFWGTANPYPYGGSKTYPNGSAYAGNDLYTDSLLVINVLDGTLAWFDQVTSHDVRDYDFEDPPLLVVARGTERVIGAGKAGLVVAWDAMTHRRSWAAEVGVHVHDRGPLPAGRVLVCPGLLGGVETPMAAADGLVFVPVVDLCMKGSAVGYQALATVDVSSGTGELVALSAATGARVWTQRLPQPDFGCATVADGVVFTSTFGGDVYAFDTRDGARLWRTRLAADINSCPALSGDMLLVGAGLPRSKGGGVELDALSVR